MKPDSTLGRHLHTFFHEYLTTQRNVSPHTVLAYRNALKLLLRFAMKRLGKGVEGLVFEDLAVDTVLGFLDHLEHERGNTVATRNARLDGIDRSTPEGRRDYALVAFAYQTGARVQEIIALRACDLQLDVLSQVRIWGKGRKERIVPLWPKTAALLRAWIEERKVDPRGTATIFVNLRGRPLSRWGVRYILKKHARGAAAACPTIAGKRVHPHVIRHTMAVHALESGVDTSAIRDLLGHESVETTWRYTRLRMEMKRKAIEACAPSRAADEPSVPIWRRDPDLLARLEAIGRRRDYVESHAP